MIFNKKQNLTFMIPQGIILLFIIIFFSCRLIPKSINVGDCILLTVEKGDVFEPIMATGTVESENEVLIRCPYSSILKRIYKEPGSRVQRGDAILMMEDEQIKEEIDKIKDQLDLKRNTLEKNLKRYISNNNYTITTKFKKINFTHAQNDKLILYS